MFEIEGTIIEILEPVKVGQGYKQQIAIESKSGRYIDTYCFEAWTDSIPLDKFQQNQTVKCKFTVSSRKYIDKYFTNLRLISIIALVINEIKQSKDTFEDIGLTTGKNEKTFNPSKIDKKELSPINDFPF